MSNKEIVRLPFVQTENGMKDYWATAQESGRWGDDNLVGRGYADDLIAQCPADQLGMILSHICQAITTKGRYGAIEVGFFNRLGEVASLAPLAREVREMRAAA